MDASNRIGEVAVQLRNLNPKEKLVLRLRFALDGSYNHTLQDIADGLGITKDQVRAIEQEALAKLAAIAA
jgi:RNA polymerase primary sigma factor